MSGFGQVVMVDALMAADESIKEIRNIQRDCNYCGKPFQAVTGDLERLCPECRRERK